MGKVRDLFFLKSDASSWGGDLKIEAELKTKSAAFIHETITEYGAELPRQKTWGRQG